MTQLLGKVVELCMSAVLFRRSFAFVGEDKEGCCWRSHQAHSSQWLLKTKMSHSCERGEVQITRELKGTLIESVGMLRPDQANLGMSYVLQFGSGSSLLRLFFVVHC